MTLREIFRSADWRGFTRGKRRARVAAEFFYPAAPYGLGPFPCSQGLGSGDPHNLLKRSPGEPGCRPPQRKTAPPDEGYVIWLPRRSESTSREPHLRRVRRLARRQ